MRVHVLLTYIYVLCLCVFSVHLHPMNRRNASASNLIVNKSTSTQNNLNIFVHENATKKSVKFTRVDAGHFHINRHTTEDERWTKYLVWLAIAIAFEVMLTLIIFCERRHCQYLMNKLSNLYTMCRRWR